MSDPMQDFLATRAAAGKPDDAWARQLAAGALPVSPSQPASGAAIPVAGSTPAGGGAAAQSGPSGAASQAVASGVAPPAGDASQPFGLRVANAFTRWAQQKDLERQQQATAEKVPLPAAGSAFTGDVADAWNTLKANLQDTGLTDLPAARDKFMNESFWQKMQDAYQREIADGKTVTAAFGLATSPIAGVADEITSAIGKGGEALIGVPARAIKDALDKATLALAPEKAGVGAVAADAEKAGAAAAKVAEPLPEAAKAASTLPQGEDGSVPQGESGRAFDIAGDHPGAALKITPEVRQQAADFFAGKRDNPIAVHLDALANPDTRVEAISDIAKAIPKDRVKSVDVTEMGAYSLNLSPGEVIDSIRPKFPSDEHWAAANMAINSASEVFHGLSVQAMTTGAPEDMEAATKAFAQLNDFVGAVRDAKTDWGRAGRIQQEAAGLRSDWTKAIGDVVTDVGPDNVEQVVKRVANLDDPAKASPFVSSLRTMSTREAMLYGWYNVLLSHAVVVKKIATDLSLAAYNVPVRLWAEKFGSGGVQNGESMALLKGYLGGMGDAIRAAGKGLKAGQSQFLGDSQSLIDGQLLDRAKALQAGTGDAHSAAVAQSPTLSALEKLRVFLPTSAMAAADDFGKTFNYRAQLHSLAWREGMAKGLDGDALAQHMSDRLNNVLPDMHNQAVDYALRNTLTEPLEGLAKSFQDAVDGVNIPIGKTGVSIPLGRMVLPFTKVSVNALRYAYRNSPLPLVLPSTSYKAALAAGGATRDLAQAQVGLGTGVSMIIGALALDGTIDGAGPSAPDLQAAWRRAGHTPYTIRIGGENVRYDRVEPLATLISVIADTHDLMKYAKDEDASALATSLVFGVGHAVVNKTYMSGLSNFLDAVHTPDQSGAKYAQNLLASMAMPGDAAMLARGLDPFLRTHRGFMDSIQARTPGLSDALPPARNLWGDAIPRETLLGPLGRMFSPVTLSSNAEAQPIDKWIWAHRADFPNGPEGRIGMEPPGQIFAGDNAKVRLSDQQLDRFKVLAGNETKDPSTGLGAKDGLNALVQGEFPNRVVQEMWNRGPPARQAVMVANMWREYREAAKAQLLGEDSKLQGDLNDAAQAHAAVMQAPNFGGTQ